MQDDFLRRKRAGLLEEQLHVVEVRRHRGGVVQIREVRVALAAAARRGLKEHVVREDRNDAVGRRILDVELREVSVGVPCRPAAAGVGASGQVLIAEPERRGRLHRRGSAGTVGHAELEPVRPSGGQWSERLRGGSGEQADDEEEYSSRRTGLHGTPVGASCREPSQDTATFGRCAKRAMIGRDAGPMPVIVGVPRSGTTLLRMMVDANAEVAIPPETGFLPALADVDPSVDARETAWQIMTGFHTWSDFGLDPATLRAALREGSGSAADCARAFYRAYARRFGKARWGDKTPTYGDEMDRIAALLPEARFVHIIRDGRDVVASVRGLWFRPGETVEACARDWAARLAHTRALGAHLPSISRSTTNTLSDPPSARFARYAISSNCRSIRGCWRSIRAPPRGWTSIKRAMTPPAA